MLLLNWTASLTFLRDVKHGLTKTSKWKKADLECQSHSHVHLFYALVSKAYFISCPLIWDFCHLINSVSCQTDSSSVDGRTVSLSCLPHCPECVLTSPFLAMLVVGSDDQIPAHFGENAWKTMSTISQVLTTFCKNLITHSKGEKWGGF